MSLHTIELTRSRGHRRVDGVESPRHRADAATETTSRVDGVGRPKFDSLTGACKIDAEMSRRGKKCVVCCVPKTIDNDVRDAVSVPL